MTDFNSLRFSHPYEHNSPLDVLHDASSVVTLLETLFDNPGAIDLTPQKERACPVHGLVFLLSCVRHSIDEATTALSQRDKAMLEGAQNIRPNPKIDPEDALGDRMERYPKANRRKSA